MAIIDLTKQKFGRLTVIKRVENDKQGHSQWLCECECKNEDKNKVIVRGIHLNKGAIKSCGCLQKELMSARQKKYNTYDLSGKFGIGYTLKNEPFYFDLEDYEKIKNYCWRIDNYGYIVTNKNNKLIKIHRIIMDFPDDMDVDHIYHINHDNRKEFLRITTHSQNMMNQKIRKNNTSGVTGVTWNKKLNKWAARIVVNYKNIHLGYFNNIEEAITIRKKAELKYFGEYRNKTNDMLLVDFKNLKKEKVEI